VQLTPDAALTARIRSRLDARLQHDVAHPVALALSGGGDSMALLRIASAWARDRGRRLLAITIDHGLNPASADWSRVCARAARDAGVDWIERRWTGDKPATGLTAAARAARHALIGAAARDAGARVVLLAHTADDIAEADWMRDRGSTLGRLRDWSPSPAWPEGRGLMLLRPLLNERRATLRDLLRADGLDWIEDPANADDRFGRARARAALGQAAPGPAKAPIPAVAPPARAETPGDGTWLWWGGLSLGRARGWNDEAGDLRGLGAAVVCATGAMTPVSRARLQALSDRLASDPPFTATLAGARVVADRAGVLIGREPGELRRRAVRDVDLAPGVPAVWDGRFEISILEAGWRVTAAAGRLNALSDADRAVVRTVPAWARGALPVLIRDEGTAPVLAWRIAGVRALAPRRLQLALAGFGDETTQEADLFRSIHGETPPSDLFSLTEHNNGGPLGAPRDREP